MEKCPLCSAQMTNGKCSFCGYQSPDEAVVAAPYNYDPSDYNIAEKQPAPKPSNDMMAGISADSPRDMSYINGSGAVNVKDGQYNALNSPEYQDASNPNYGYITKESSLQEDMRRFYADRAAAGMYGNTPQANINRNAPKANTYGSYNTAGTAANIPAGGNPYGSSAPADNNANINTGASPYGSFNPADNNANPAAGANPYGNFNPANNSVNKGASPYRSFDSMSSGNPLGELGKMSFEDNTDYSGMNTSDMIVKKTVNFIIRRGWQFVLLLLVPSLGVIIGSVYFFKFRTSAEKKPSDIALGIVFFAGTLFLKFQRIDLLGIDSTIWHIIRILR